MKARKEVIRSSPGLSFSFRERDEPLSFSWHRHREYELTYVRWGTGKRYIGDDVSSFAAGDLVLIGPNVPHAYQSSRGSLREACSFVIVQFPQELFGAGLRHLRELRAIHGLLAHASNGLAFDRATARLIAPLVQQATRHEELAKLLDLTHILDLLARKGQAKEIATEWQNEEAAPRPARRQDADILQYVFDHSAGRLSLTRVAEVAGVSIATLCRYFRRDLGCTFNEYVTRIRISRACALLIQTNLPVYSISYEVGFENLSNFNRRFLSLKEMTPSGYRRAHRGIVSANPPSKAASSA